MGGGVHDYTCSLGPLKLNQVKDQLDQLASRLSFTAELLTASLELNKQRQTVVDKCSRSQMGKWPMRPICSLLWHNLTFSWMQPLFIVKQERRKEAKNKKTPFSKEWGKGYKFSNLHETWRELNSTRITPTLCQHSVFVIAVADRRQRQSLWGHLLADAGEASVRLGRPELWNQLWAAEGTLQRQNADTGTPWSVPRWGRDWRSVWITSQAASKQFRFDFEFLNQTNIFMTHISASFTSIILVSC